MRRCVPTSLSEIRLCWIQRADTILYPFTNVLAVSSTVIESPWPPRTHLVNVAETASSFRYSTFVQAQTIHWNGEFLFCGEKTLWVCYEVHWMAHVSQQSQRPCRGSCHWRQSLCLHCFVVILGIPGIFLALRMSKPSTEPIILYNRRVPGNLYNKDKHRHLAADQSSENASKFDFVSLLMYLKSLLSLCQ